MTLSRLLVLLAGAGIALADNTGTVNIAAGGGFSFDSGTPVNSGGDLLFTGTSVNAQGSAKFSNVGTGGATAFGFLSSQALALLPYTATTIGSLAVNEVFAVQTNGGNFAKALVTAVSGSSITFQYQTYGNTTGGGGNVPTITSVQNNYGQVAQGLPNYGIAPSALFYITGSALASVTTSLQSSASPGLQTTLNNVTVTVSVGGASVNCPIYYLSPTQIDAVLPGSTPTGIGTIVVNNNGSKSSPAPITVVQSAFGILNYNGSLAATYDANNALITATNAANPGQTIVIWGSGVGYDPKDDDKIFPQSQDNLSNIPIKVYVGGAQATILYQGRSQYPGVDQIVVTLPNSIPTGCYVSLAVVSGTGSSAIVSNGTTIPVAASGKTCSDSNNLFSPQLIQTLTGKSSVRIGFLQLTQTTSIGAGSGNGGQVSNIIAGAFTNVTGTNYSSSVGVNLVSIGSCLVTNPLFTGNPLTTTATGLDAGPGIMVNGPQGSLTLTPLSIPGQSLKIYTTSNTPSNFIPAAGGSFTFDNGNGGTDVGHFNATTTFPQNFTWTNNAAVSPIDRTQGVTVTWSGGSPGAYVTISGSASAFANGQTIAGSFICQAPLSAGQFTVPPPVLLALPSGQGSLSLTDSTNPQSFTASGLDLGYLLNSSTFTANVRYN